MFLPPVARNFNYPDMVMGLPMLAAWTFLWFLVFTITAAIGILKEVI